MFQHSVIVTIKAEVKSVRSEYTDICVKCPSFK